MDRLERPGLARRAVLLVAAILTAAAGPTACGSLPPATSGPPATGTFIGTVGADELIAVVVGPAGDARGLLYGPAPTNPDGTARTFEELTSEWFDGIALTDDTLEGSSASGVVLRAALTPQAVTGTVSGPGRAEQAFEALPASGTAGLYDVSYDPASRTLMGSSATGATMTGAAPGSVVQQTEPVTLTVTPANGPPAQFPVDFFVGENPSVIQLGFIIAQDGTIRGGPRKTTNTSGGSGGQFTCPLID